MTVLDECIMSSSLGGDRYITPEYLAPLPQKDVVSDKSPLQLLAQTCSQIGADPGSNKILDRQKLGTDKSSKSSSSSKIGSSPTIVVSDSKPVPFKPYDITKDSSTNAAARVEAKRSSGSSAASNSSPKSTPVTTTTSPATSRGSTSPTSAENKNEPKITENGKGSPPHRSSSETLPTIRSGMEILAGHPKDLPLGTYRPPVPGSLPGFDLNPAFRLPMAGLYPPPTSGVAGSVCRDPYCKDPTCPTAIYNAYVARLTAPSAAAAGLASLPPRGLPPGYLELLEAQKMAALGLPGGLQAASVPTSLASSAALGPTGPYICNWMNGRDYCGKRFTSAEELLVHLKTHTNLSTSDSSLLNPYAPGGLLGSSPPMIRPGTAGPVLPSALSLQRYSPYQRPGAPALPPSLSGLGTGLPPSFGGLPPSLASLAGYPASLYALYGARL